MATILAASQTAVATFTVLLATMAGASLVVGGVSTMDFMVVAVGLVFGTYPSWRAACLDPIKALRREQEPAPRGNLCDAPVF